MILCRKVLLLTRTGWWSLKTPRRRLTSGGIILGWLQSALAEVADEATLMRVLRQFRRRVMVRIAWAQALELVSEESTLQQLSELAQTLIVAARDWLYAACCKEWHAVQRGRGSSAAVDSGDG